MRRDSAPRVAGVVLAAGLSSRMGENKLLLEIAGESLLRRAVWRAIAARLDPVIVVLGHEAELASREIEDLDCQSVLNTEYRDGIGTSLKAGLAAVPESAAAAVSMLADMPYVTAEMLARIMDTFRESDSRLVLSEYNGVTAHPVLFARRLFEEVLQAPEKGGLAVIERHRDHASEISWSSTALEDIDLPDDFEEARHRLESR